MVLTRRDVVRMGLASAGAVALGARARAAGRFHLGLVTYNVAKEWDLDTLLRLVREAGFEGVEFRTTHAHGVERTLTPAERQDVRKKCADAGLLQTSLGIGLRVPLARPGGREEEHRGLPRVGPPREGHRGAGRQGAAERAAEGRARGEDARADRPGARGVRRLRAGPRRRDLGRGPRRPDEGPGPDAADHGRLLPPERGPDVELERHGRRGRLGGRVVRAPAAVHPLLPHHRPAERATRTASSSPCSRGRASPGFTLCEFPEPVPAFNGAAWLRDYRERWEGLQAGLRRRRALRTGLSTRRIRRRNAPSEHARTPPRPAPGFRIVLSIRIQSRCIFVDLDGFDPP